MTPKYGSRRIARRSGSSPVATGRTAATTVRQGGSQEWLAGGGEMGKLIRSMDWSATPLGPIDTWPQSLRTMVSVCLASNFPLNIVWGPRHVQIYNDGYQPICGAKHPRSMGQEFRECWASAWPVIGEAFDRALAGGAHFLENQRMFLDRNGYLEETYFTSSFSPIRDETGGVGGIFHPATETTARMLSERRMRALRDLAACAGEAQTAEEACALITRTLADYTFDLPFVLLYLVDESGARARLAGATGLEPGMAASPIEVELCALGDRGWPLARVVAKGRPEQVDTLERQLGALRCGPYPEPPRAAFVFPIQSPGPDLPLGLLVAGVSARLALDDAYRDFYEMLASAVTAAVSGARAHQEERRRADALAEIDRLKTTFFSNVSHELRTPLTLILGLMEDGLAGTGETLPRRQRQVQETIHRNALRLLKLVNTLLDFSRIEAGRLQASFEPVDLSALTADLASNFRSAIERAGLRLVVDAPPSPEDVYVDREMWEKIVLHLLSNALKFTFEGEIEVALRATREHAVLAVRDTGAGIPPEELPRVFSTPIGAAPFVEEAQRWLPGAPAEPPEVRPDVGAGRPAPADEAGPRARILVADDNADMRDYLTSLLGRTWDVSAVGDGTAALRAARDDPPDLVLSDAMMPGLDGFQLLGALRGGERTKTIPIILLSARAGEEATIEGLQAGADDYLVKPFSARELVARVRATLALSLLRRELEEKQAELLALGEDRLHIAMEATGLGIWEMDPKTQKISCNERCTALLGLQPGIPVDYERALTAMHPDDRERVREAVQRALDPAGDGAYAVEYRTLGLHDGVERWIAARGRVLFDAGRVVRFLGTILDITERAELMAREQRARAVAEEANRLKDEFLATVSHELRTPLTSIMGWASILGRKPPSAATLAQGIEVIDRNARAQKAIIEDILDVSRIITGNLRVEQERVDFDAVVKEAIDVVMPSAAAKDIDVHYARGGGRWHLVGDPSRLRQIVWNLVSNAVKFTPPGGRVKVALDREGGVVRLRVEDTGEGIAPELIAHIFDRFRQADGSTTRRHGGLGLGLSIVRHLVELHGGEVHAESPGKGRGATFTIELPVGAISPELTPSRDAGAGKRPPPTHAPEQALEGVRVLVVDDEEDARESVKVCLADYGAIVATAGSAEEALRAVARFHPDVLVSDIGMPGEDGIALIQRIRAPSHADHGLPAIALTAYAHAQDASLALSAGFQKHLPKPIDGGTLARAVVEVRTAQLAARCSPPSWETCETGTARG